jgi:hypothetical protein
MTTAMAARFREQARACGQLGSPMYAELLGRAAEDIDAKGQVATVLRGHEHDPGPSALALRLAGSVHRLVLERRAEALALFYPSVGGRWDIAAAWSAFEALLVDRGEEVRAWLDRPPQTNEVGRAAALVGGLLRLDPAHRLPVRLFEIGASGGLNLRADRFRFRHQDGSTHGPPDSPVRLDDAWAGAPLTAWPDLEIVERVGGDVSPVDVRSTEGRLLLTAYCWPDQPTRLARLRAAFEVAAQHAAEVRRVDAVSLVEDIELATGTTTVLWHSVMWQYLSRLDQDAVTERISRLGAAAREDAPFAHLSLEPDRRATAEDHQFLVVLEQWPVGGRRVLGTAAPHGLPTTWE